MGPPLLSLSQCLSGSSHQSYALPPSCSAQGHTCFRFRRKASRISPPSSISAALQPLHSARCRRPEYHVRCCSNAAARTEPQTGESGSQRRRSFRILPRLRSKHDADIFNIAIPALFAILLDPVMSLVDAALVGRLGTVPLAGVGCGTVVLVMCAVLFNFLLFVTTPAVARAVAQQNINEASRVTARGLQLAILLGSLAGALTFRYAGAALAFFAKDPAVLHHALAYVRCRLIALPALLSIFTLAGGFRGHQDTRTPLIAAVVSNIANFGLDMLFMFVFGWGVAGAALATSASQYISAAIMLMLQVRNGMLQLHHVLERPLWHDWAPLIKAGAALSVRSLVSFSIVIVATKQVGSYGTVALATNEILRQTYLFSIQFLSSMDVSAQALVASHLGKGDQTEAKAVAIRILQLALLVATGLAALLFANRRWLPRIFTRDAAVIAMASLHLPILSVFLPFDAAASIVDGSLLGASETTYVGGAMLINTAITMAIFLPLTRWQPGLTSVWVGMKVMTLGRIISGSLRIRSPRSRFNFVAA